MDKFTSINFLIITISLIFEEKSRLNKIITPYSVTAFPFIIIVLFNNFILIQYDFPPVTTRVQYFILTQLIVLWIVGYLLSNYFLRGKILTINIYGSIFDEFRRFDIVLVIIAWIAIAFIVRKILHLFALEGGWTYFVHPDYEKRIAEGLDAHMIHVGKVCFLFLIFIYKKSKHKFLILVTLLGLFIAISAIQIKYHILWLILMAFYFRIADKHPKTQIWNLGLVAITMLIVFNLFWIVITLATENSNKYGGNILSYLVKQTGTYLFTGPILLDHWLNHASVKPDWTLIINLKNLINVVSGNPIRYNNVPLLNLGFERVAKDIYSNVGTAYGVYYLIGGYLFTFAMTILTSIIYYLTFFYSYIKYRFDLIFFNVFFLSLATLTFFVQYFTSLATFEMIIVFFVFSITFKAVNILITKLHSVSY